RARAASSGLRSRADRRSASRPPSTSPRRSARRSTAPRSARTTRSRRTAAASTEPPTTAWGDPRPRHPRALRRSAGGLAPTSGSKPARAVMTTIVRQAGGLVLAAAIAAGSYGIDVDRSAGARQSAARIVVIRPAPERPVALGAVDADRRRRSAGRRARSGTARRATVPTPAWQRVVVPPHPVAPRTVALSAPP